MPVYLRNFYVKELIKVKKEEEKQAKKQNPKSKGVSSPPSYSKPARKR